MTTDDQKEEKLGYMSIYVDGYYHSAAWGMGKCIKREHLEV